MHVERLRLDKPEDIAALVGKNGGDAAKFLAAFKSFSVATAVAQSKKMPADYKIDGVPTPDDPGPLPHLAVAGGSEARSLPVADAPRPC